MTLNPKTLLIKREGNNGGLAAKVATAVVSAGVGAVMTLYFVALVAAVHRQLAGPSPDAASAPFE